MNEVAIRKGYLEEQAKKAKIDRFNQQSDRKVEFYKEHILKPKEEILKKRDMQLERENCDYLNKVDKRNLTEEHNKKAAHRYHLQELQKQIDSNKARKSQEQEQRREKTNTTIWTGPPSAIGRNTNRLNGIDASLRGALGRSAGDLKRERQYEYKLALDSQNEELKKYRQGGNMTQAEKSLNRHDLIAYKNKDETNYAMLPGISPTKHFMDPVKYPEITKQKAKLTLAEKQERL